MKKEILAFLLLGAIALLSIWNLRRLDQLIEPILTMAEEAFVQSNTGNTDEAADTALRAEKSWLEAGPYTHIFLRHPEVDAVTDAFCTFRGAIAGGDPGEVFGAYLSLLTRLRGIREMEQPRLGCIF